MCIYLFTWKRQVVQLIWRYGQIRKQGFVNVNVPGLSWYVQALRSWVISGFPLLIEVYSFLKDRQQCNLSQRFLQNQMWSYTIMVPIISCIIVPDIQNSGLIGRKMLKVRSLGTWGILSKFSSVQSLSCVRLFVTPWITACQASLSITNSQSSPKLMSIESVMPSSHLILCCPLLLLPPVPPSIRVFSNESTVHMRWPKYWSFSLSISPSKEHPGLVSFRMDWLDLLAVQGY